MSFTHEQTQRHRTDCKLLSKRFSLDYLIFVAESHLKFHIHTTTHFVFLFFIYLLLLRSLSHFCTQMWTTFVCAFVGFLLTFPLTFSHFPSVQSVFCSLSTPTPLQSSTHSISLSSSLLSPSSSSSSFLIYFCVNFFTNLRMKTIRWWHKPFSIMNSNLWIALTRSHKFHFTSIYFTLVCCVFYSLVCWYCCCMHTSHIYKCCSLYTSRHVVVCINLHFIAAPWCCSVYM